MIGSDESAQEQLVKEYVNNAKKFYEHIEGCESCSTKLAEIWQHVYKQ